MRFDRHSAGRAAGGAAAVAAAWWFSRSDTWAVLLVLLAPLLWLLWCGGRCRCRGGAWGWRR